MAATVMTVEFGTIHHYSSLEENSEICLYSSRVQIVIEHCVNYNMLVYTVKKVFEQKLFKILNNLFKICQFKQQFINQ